jgi:hypothetical protein
MTALYIFLGLLLAVVAVLGWCAIWHAGTVSREEERDD